MVIAWLLRDLIRMGNDDAIYLQLSRSLRTLSYREEWIVGAPWHSQYPPLYPMLLAVISAFVGERLDVLLAAMTLLSAGALILIFDAVRRLWSPMLALMVLAVCAVNGAILENAGDIGSEAPYMALSVLSLWFLARRQDTKVSIFMALAAAVAAALTRSVGVTLVLAIPLTWLMERHYKRAAIFGATAALLVGSWLAWTFVAPQKAPERTYVGDATKLIREAARYDTPSHLRRVMGNGRHYLLADLPSQMDAPTIPGTLVDNIVWLLLVAACSLVGAFMIWRRAWRVVVVYLLLYIGLLLLWSWPIERFLDPIVPFAFLALLAGASALGKRLFPRASSAPALTLTALIITSSLVRVTPAIASAISCDRSSPLQSTTCYSAEERAFMAATVYAREQTPAETRFVTSKEGAWGYHTGRKLVPIERVVGSGSEGIIARLIGANVDYLFIGTNQGRERSLKIALSPVCDRLEVVQRFQPQAAILRILPGFQTDPDRAACPFLAIEKRQPRNVLKKRFKLGR